MGQLYKGLSQILMGQGGTYKNYYQFLTQGNYPRDTFIKFLFIEILMEKIQALVEEFLDHIAEILFYELMLFKHLLAIEIAKAKGRKLLKNEEIIEFLEELKRKL